MAGHKPKNRGRVSYVTCPYVVFSPDLWQFIAWYEMFSPYLMWVLVHARSWFQIRCLSHDPCSHADTMLWSNIFTALTTKNTSSQFQWSRCRISARRSRHTVLCTQCLLVNEKEIRYHEKLSYQKWLRLNPERMNGFLWFFFCCFFGRGVWNRKPTTLNIACSHEVASLETGKADVLAKQGSKAWTFRPSGQLQGGRPSCDATTTNCGPRAGRGQLTRSDPPATKEPTNCPVPIKNWLLTYRRMSL